MFVGVRKAIGLQILQDHGVQIENQVEIDECDTSNTICFNEDHRPVPLIVCMKTSRLVSPFDDEHYPCDSLGG